MRDPIHIHMLTGGDGRHASDWTLVLDYHKGAHDLKLCEMEGEELVMLEVTEHDSVYHFALGDPAQVNSMRAAGVPLPLVPGKLCEDF